MLKKIKALFTDAQTLRAENTMLEDSKGRLCPAKTFKEVQLAKTLMIKSVAAQASEAAKQREALHANLIALIEEYFSYAAKFHKCKPLDSEDGVTMTSLDGLFKLTIDKTMAQLPNENIVMAKNAFDDMIEKHSKGVEVFFKTSALKSFELSAKGLVRVDKINELRSMECPYSEWAGIKELLDKGVDPVFKKRYLRVHIRESVNDDWQQVEF